MKRKKWRKKGQPAEQRQHTQQRTAVAPLDSQYSQQQPRRRRSPITGQHTTQPNPATRPNPVPPKRRKRRHTSRKSRTARLRRRTRRQHVGTLIYRLICVALVIGAGMVAISMFFKIDSIEVNGQSRYSSDEIRLTIGVEPGDNLIFLGKQPIVQRLLHEYPYISNVEIRRKLPDTLAVTIMESPAFATVADSSGGGYLINDQGKLLEHLENISASTLPFITGVTVDNKEPGEVLGGDEASNRLVTLLTVLKKEGLQKDIDFINLTQFSDIHIGYLGRFDVQLGSIDNVERKLGFLIEINKRLSPSDIGVIELSNAATASFWPETEEQVQAASGRVQQAEPQDDMASDNPDEAQDPDKAQTQDTDDTQGSEDTAEKEPEDSGDEA